SAVDPNQTATSSVVIELAAPPSKEWPQFHHDRERGGVNPEPFQGPLTPQWTTSVGGGFPIQWTGSIIDGHVVFVTSPAGVISALDLGTGTILWQKSFGAGGDISGTPAASHGILYVTFVTGVHTGTGSQRWQASKGNTLTSAPTGAGGVVYVGDYSGVVHALDALTGQKIWDSPAVGALVDVSSPVVAGGYVFEGSFAFDFFSGLMTALDVNTGQVVWQYFMPAGAVGTSAAYNNGTVFLSTWDGNLWS